MSSPSDRKLFLNLSNRIEILAAELGRVLKAEVSDPMKPQQVMVHSAVTARWLAMELAEHNGISMGVEYTFPRIVIDEMLEKVVPEVTASPHFTSESMTWWIFQHVPDYLTKPEFAEVSEYLKSGDDVRRYQLAGKAAWLLHQYQLYRPDMLRDWESANTGDHWQQTLWREMRRQYKGEHSFIDQLQMVHQLSEEAIRDAGLPERLSIFGLNTLTPAYLKILWKISTTTQIDLYLLAPTDQYWGDLTTRKKSTRFLNEEDLSQGNPLLGSWGTLSRDLINQLVDLDFQQRFEYFETPSSATMISCIQRDLQNLEDRTGTEIREKVPDGDVS
ncbi:MAG: exodeoxyribonuclease V subunit gamma, partial [Verrucomicrobiae bacterium]|nr:exodeoxyribonuclease V subunit gamma [Verrucomicrobiae bacterium]